MSWAEFSRFLHETRAPDVDKITLLAVVVRAKGKAGQRVDVEEMMGVLERSRRTITQTLERLADGDRPWLHRTTTTSPKERPMFAWYTVRKVADA